jgi:thiosulfate dehydrogenase (quinone) large subunit
MITNWMRKNVYASALFTLLRFYLGYHWITGGYHKIADGFDATGFLKGGIAKATGDHPAVQSWWAGFLEGFALPNVELFNVLVPWGEFLVGIALILGIFTTFAALMGATMNFAFMFSGTTSTNPQMVLLTVFILVAGANAGKFGLDYYVLPYLRKVMNVKEKKEVTTTNL